MASNIPITAGSGTASVATEQIGAVQFQQIKVIGGDVGSTSVLSVNPDGSAKVSVLGTVATREVSSIAVAIVSGSVAGVPNQSVSGTVQTDVRGSVAVAIISGSIAASFTPPANQSVSGTVQTDVRGSVAVAIISGSIAASFTPPANQSVSGTVQADIRGSVATVIIGGSVATATTNSSVMLLNGANTIGSVTALQGTNPWTVVSSVAGGIFPVSGSVAAVITNTNVNVSGSVVAVQSTTWPGSVAAVQAGTWKTSIASNYATGAASVVSAIGNLALGVRNDTLASVLALSDGQYIPWTVGPAGENITANAPYTKWVQGTADFRSNTGGSVAVIAAQGASIFTYVTGVQIANMGSASVLVTLSGATSSIIGYTIAPAGGGSNIVYPNALKTNANGAFTASISGVASVLVSAQGFISKT